MANTSDTKQFILERLDELFLPKGLREEIIRSFDTMGEAERRNLANSLDELARGIAGIIQKGKKEIENL